MDSENTFHYTYSAVENQEVLNIRKKYLPREETKLEELKRLDEQVQASGKAEALCAGVSGTMLLGIGMCLAMGVIGDVVWLGVVLDLAGMAGVLAAFPAYRKAYHKAKNRYAPRIIELAAELGGQI